MTKHTSMKTTRRRFLQAGVMTTAGLCLSSRTSIATSYAANEKLNVAVVGVGGRGHANLTGVAHEETNIVGLCDVDDHRAAGSFKQFPAAKKYRDFRRMIDELEKQIDAVVVSTADHTHAVAGVYAMERGKHLYCEKPMTHNVYECRRMTEIAAKRKLCTQLGTQIHAGANYRRVVELVQAGTIGPVTEVHVWQPSGYNVPGRPKETPPVPATLDWDLWIGPAPMRPYHPCYLPGSWRAWWDFANGGLGDFFCHYVDLPFWALELRYPTSVVAEGPPVHAESCPPWIIVNYEFPARGKLPPVKLTYYGGGKRPEIQTRAKLPNWGSGVLFVGDRGMLLADYGNHRLFPEEKFAGFKPPAQTIPASVGHHREWVQACKKGGATTCNFGYSGPLTEAALLANVAFRSGEKLEWDGPNMRVTNSPKAERFIRREYRKGWSI